MQALLERARAALRAEQCVLYLAARDEAAEAVVGMRLWTRAVDGLGTRIEVAAPRLCAGAEQRSVPLYELKALC